MYFCFVMATQRILTDQDFGRIVIRTRRTARNISMRVRPEGLFLIVPPYNRVDKILEAIKPFRPDLLENFRKVAVRRIDLGFSIRTECFRLSLAPSKLRCFTVREEEEGMKIYCPADTDFGREDVQKLVRNAIVRALKKRAEAYLPPLLEAWSVRYGLPYRKVRITGARSCWGSCTAARTISLSCYLMLVPAHLMDYVMLHELAHTREMNHGPRFWELLDSMTGGQEHRLRAELRGFHTGF